MKISPLILKPLLIIGIPILIATVSFPLFSRARENAQRESCASGLKQIGLGFLQYAQDYEGHLPPVEFTTFIPPKNNQSQSEGAYGWVDGLQPYLKATSIFQCPSDFAGSGPSRPRSDFPPYTSYWMNTRLAGTKISGPISHLVLFGDGLRLDPRSTARYALSAPPDQKELCDSSNGRCQSAWKHLGGANFGFLDGHIKWLRPNEVNATKGAPATFAS